MEAEPDRRHLKVGSKPMSGHNVRQAVAVFGGSDWSPGRQVPCFAPNIKGLVANAGRDT